MRGEPRRRLPDAGVRARSTAPHDAIAPDQDGAVRERGVARPRERQRFDRREPFRRIGRLQITLIAELHARSKGPDVALDSLRISSGASSRP